MAGFFNLTVNARNAFFRSLPMPKFLELVTGKLIADEEILGEKYTLEDVAEFHRQARFAFFDRQDFQAYRYQSSLLNSWMMTLLSATKKLPFIKNEADRREWLNVLERCVNDPFRPLTNKIHACLLMNALFPSDEDRYQGIVESIMHRFSTHTDVYQSFKVYGPLLNAETIQKLLLELNTALDHAYPDRVKHRAALALVDLMRYLPKNEQGKLQQRFIKQWKEAHLDTVGNAAEILSGMVGALSREEKDQAFQRCMDWFKKNPNTDLYFKLTRFALALVPVLKDEQKRALFDLFYPVIDGVMTDMNKGFTQSYFRYVALLFLLAPQLSEAHKRELLSEDKNKHPPAHLQLALAASLSATKKEALLAKLIAALDCDEKAITQPEIDAFDLPHHTGAQKAKLIACHRRKTTASTLAVLLPALSEANKQIVTAALFPKLMDPDQEVAKAAAGTLEHCGAYLSKPQILLLLDFSYVHSGNRGDSDDADFDALDFLAPLTPYLEDLELKSLRDRVMPLYSPVPYLAHTLMRIREINQTPAPVSNPVRFFRSPVAAPTPAPDNASSVSERVTNTI
jgi:hypothetical protein